MIPSLVVTSCRWQSGGALSASSTTARATVTTTAPSTTSSPAATTSSPSQHRALPPHAYSSFTGVTSLPAFKKKYAAIETGAEGAEEVRVGGRLCAVRHMGSILFLTIRNADGTLQVIRRVTADFSRAQLKALKQQLNVGDIIGATGVAGKTKSGELSLYASDIRVLTPYVCADQAVCPGMKGFSSVTDPDIAYRYRFLDLMSNAQTAANFRKRHTLLKALRAYLDGRHFVEVETPILHDVASGANARPFVTHHEQYRADLHLRVAPELQLKQCVVGGMDRVYEVGRVFRNEDADRHHNPEFTSCELYAAYESYDTLMPFTEHLMCHLAEAVNGVPWVEINSSVTKKKEKIRFDLPFARISAFDAVQEAVGHVLPPPLELPTPRGEAYLAAVLLRHDVPLPAVRTASHMFDKLLSFFVTDRIVQPTFVTDHPICMSPLAKAHEAGSRLEGLSERFELFIDGVEFCNAYSELNDPVEQLKRFEAQLHDRQCGDDEAMGLDETFLKALQVGLPPTGGWGLGVDRLVALLNGSASIRDAILCPRLRSDSTSRDGKRQRKAASFFSLNHRMVSFVLHGLEEEMRRCGIPTTRCDRVRELQDVILRLRQPDTAHRHRLFAPLTRQEAVRGEDWTLKVLKMFCGRGRY